MSLSERQKKRIVQLKKYIDEVEQVERIDFDKWFKGKKQFCVNIGAYIILIEEDE